jgi:hypothetical protein
MVVFAFIGWLLVTVIGVMLVLAGSAVQLFSGIGGAGRFEPNFPIYVAIGGLLLYFSYLHCPFHLSFSSVGM